MYGSVKSGSSASGTLFPLKSFEASSESYLLHTFLLSENSLSSTFDGVVAPKSTKPIPISP